MKRLQHAQGIALALLLMPLTPTAYASTCGALSLAYQTLDEAAYFNLDHNTTLADGDANNMSSDVRRDATSDLIKSLHKNRISVGNGTRYTCRGTGSHLRVESTIFDLEDIEVSSFNNGATEINAWEDSARKRSSARVHLPAEHEWFVEPGSNELISSKRHRRRAHPNSFDRPFNFLGNPLDLNNGLFGGNFSNCQIINSNVFTIANSNGASKVCRSYLAEIETRMRNVGQRTLITQSVFLNGRKVEWVEWYIKT